MGYVATLKCQVCGKVIQNMLARIEHKVDHVLDLAAIGASANLPKKADKGS